MRFRPEGVPSDLPIGKHPSRVGDAYTDENGKRIIPVIYDPSKRVSDSLIPIVKHADACTSRECDCTTIVHNL